MNPSPADWARRGPPVFPPPWASAWGDDVHGLWTELHIKDVVQKMRWIEPGEFIMGSPAGEGDDIEHPQHPVRITRGFWLADTVCTQALWRAVMSTNPSRFQEGIDAPLRPVERVSWDDVQDFLAQLAVAGGDLPTEAEWEYACRAGTDTAYSFGESITHGQVHYSRPWVMGYTLPVVSRPANPWGLFAMHGNVWEWCADGRRVYEDRPEADPRGPAGAAARVIRGGSWFDGAGRVRSARRFWYERGIRFDLLGFRLALRSEEPSPAPEP